MKKRRRTDRDANGRRANRRSFDDREDIAFTHEEEFVFAEFEIFARVREEEDAIAFLNCEFAARAVVKNAPVADGNDYPARRLVLSRFGKLKPAGRALFRFVATNDDAIAERLKLHTAALIFRSGVALFLSHFYTPTGSYSL